MTHLADTGRPVLAGPVAMHVESADPTTAAWASKGVRFVKRATGAAAWESESAAGPLTMKTRAQMEFDGNIEYEVEIRAAQSTVVSDIRLEIPLAAQRREVHDGHGRQGRRPAGRRTAGSGTSSTTRTRRGLAT